MVRIGIGSDDRIGKRFLFAGIGYGGSCFPKDVKALAHTAEENKYDFRLLKSVMDVNERQKTILVEKVKKYFDGNLKGKKIALWGLAFKPDTDDIREAPSLHIIDALLKEGATVTAFDPVAVKNVKQTIGDKIFYAPDQYAALKDADALVIATEWQLFRTPDFEKMKSLMKSKAIFDGRNLYEPAVMREKSFHYDSIGR
jgi:UDPglucose 6-dehydrogenase